MAKRSRDVSFSPSADDASSPVSNSNGGYESDPELLAHPPKMNANLDDQLINQIVMQCSLPPHKDAIGFPSIEAFELHYVKEHCNRCSSCNKNFPSAHFLALHIDENHNPLREELQTKGEKTYGCFVEGCEKKCSTPQKRRLHLIDKHLFPKMYNFRIIDTGLDQKSSMLKESHSRRRRVSTSSNNGHGMLQNERAQYNAQKGAKMKSLSEKDILLPSKVFDSSEQLGSVQSTQAGGLHNSRFAGISDMDELGHSMAALKFIPPSVQSQRKRPGKFSSNS